ncbi:MAG: lytic transglycosylase F [Pseudomonadota bacterium]
MRQRELYVVRSSNTSKRGSLAASLIVAVLLASGCGSDDTGPAAADEQTEARAAGQGGDTPLRDRVLAAPTVGDLLPEPMEVIWRTWTGDFSGMVERRVVRVVVPYGGYQFYYDGGMPRGAVYDLLQVFEEKINDDLERRNVRIYIAVIPVSREQLVPALLEGHADIIAGDLTLTEARSALIDFSRPLLKDVNEIVVSGAAAAGVESIDELSGREIHVRRSSSYYEHLLRLVDDFNEREVEPPLVQPLDELLETEDVLELLDSGVIEMTVLDEYKAEFWTTVFDNLTLHRDVVVSSGGSIGWAHRKDSPELAAVIDSFLREYGRGTLVGNDTYNRYLDSAERVRCSERGISNERLAKLAEHFQQYGEQYDFDWLMLAAQGLQESGLRHNRKSPAGAVGIMQIKPSTAADRNVGIDDISTPAANIHAGTKYLRFIADRYFAADGIDELNQWLLSLAAYNAGPAKINRYRNEARREGRDADIWFDNVEIVAARRIGRETVTYVSNIFKNYVSYKLMYERAQVFEDRFGELLSACTADT